MKQVIIFPRGQLTSADRRILRNNDFIPIETDDPSKVMLLFPNCERLTGDIVTMSALRALTGPHSGHERTKFATEIIAALLPK